MTTRGGLSFALAHQEAPFAATHHFVARVGALDVDYSFEL